MHCYLDLMFQGWQGVKQPSPIPLAPKVVTSTTETFTLAWVAPMGSGSAGVGSMCTNCLGDYSLVQYATEAVTSSRAKSRMDWAPHQATGMSQIEMLNPENPNVLKDCTLSGFFSKI